MASDAEALAHNLCTLCPHFQSNGGHGFNIGGAIIVYCGHPEGKRGIIGQTFIGGPPISGAMPLWCPLRVVKPPAQPQEDQRDIVEETDASPLDMGDDEF